MRNMIILTAATIAMTVAWPAIATAQSAPATGGPTIFCPAGGSPSLTLAAREVRRYIYLRTGALLPIKAVAVLPDDADGIVVTAKGRSLAPAKADELQDQQYILKTFQLGGRRVLFIVGGDDAGILFGVYRFAEHLGVRFYLHDDVLPDGKIPLEIPSLDETARPLFGLRGIQPFHDFPEGPDWWNVDDYKAIFAQLPKLRMNFIGLHTYSEASPFAEPTVWIGQTADANADGTVAFSYPASYQNTLRNSSAFGYAVKPTSQFSCGGAMLFDRDDYGPEIMRDQCGEPSTPEGRNEVFNRNAAVLREVFTFARRLGIKTCVGAETPLVVPKMVKARLEAKGLNPSDSAVQQGLYEGIFTRIMRAYPLDYYWFWTPEGWTWEGAKPEQVQATFDDVKLAIAAAKATQAPFKLATCGWVLGPPGDRAAFDRVFPKDMVMSCINREVGKTPVEPGFAAVSGREKWAIPWLEDDPALTAPQLWVGRMRRDAADARAYGCTGLMGIHWRTRTLAPNVLALARASWEQSGWVGVAVPLAEGPLGGKTAAYPDSAIDATDDDPLYQTCRFDFRGYTLAVPNGKYKVTLKFCELAYDRAGVRVFDVAVGGRTVVERLDIFAMAGKNKALDLTFDGVEVNNGRLDVYFVPRVEFPCVAAVVIEGTDCTKKINCGGPAYKDYAADLAPISDHQPTGDFYADWATAEFGPAVAGEIAAIFEKIDGRLPRPADWVGGPGGLVLDNRPWEQVQQEYAFVGELEALRPKIAGPASLERFDYWLNTFRYMRAMAQVRCVWGEYEAVMSKVRAEKDAAVQKQAAADQALPVRKRLAAVVAETYAHLLAHVSTNGELGTVANWEQHILPSLIENPRLELAKMLGEKLPAEALLGKEYAGPPRLIVPTLRTALTAGETLTVKAIVLAAKPVREAEVRWRPMGAGEFKSVPLVRVGRGVHSATIPANATTDDFEYQVRVVADDGTTLWCPAGGPEVSRTVVVMPSR